MNEYQFDAVKVRDRLVAMIQELAKEQGFSRVVLGISGGKDSSVSAALCARALGKNQVYGVMLPDGIQKDLSDSIRVCEALGIPHRIINIGEMHKALKAATDQFADPSVEALPAAGCGVSDSFFRGRQQAAGKIPEEIPAELLHTEKDTAFEQSFSIPYSKESDINVGPRLRMTTLRYIAQALGARLAGTGNLSEATVGYCTKDGDTSCDFALLGAVTSVEVVQIGLTMEELPRDLVQKTPTDGLSGMSDEDKMGLSYQDIHAYIRTGSCGNPQTDEQIRRREAANLHKRRMPVILDPWKSVEA